ncbi:M48 family metalloprotease [Streptomyces sp. NPDC058691]|uniref:M48 family metalloprotease n=1 Tax=Streptomyces sp. NPDC058691 TaxID=3346601 RepID=UPI00364DC657
MATYAVVCAAEAGATAEAVAGGPAGGWIHGGEGGTGVLFDAPVTEGEGIGINDLVPAGRGLARRLDTPAVVLVGTPQVAYAVFLRPDGEGSQTMAWAASWVPPTDPEEYAEHRAEWDAQAARCAEWFGRPGAAAALAEVRNDPRPGEEKPGSDELLRQVCAALGVPATTIGASSLTSGDGVADEGVPAGAVRAEPALPAGTETAVAKSSTLRAVRALVLLAGFYLLGAALLAVLAGVDALFASMASGAVTLKVFIGSVVLAIPIVRGMFMLRRSEDDGPAGVPVTEQQQPGLWAAVRDLAGRYGTRAPDEIVLVGEVNAAVSEESRLLGLIAGRRRMYIGMPLLAGLTERQLHAVLTHELGHYGNSDTRLSAITLRGQQRVLRTIAHFEERAARAQGREQVRQEERAAKALAKGRKAKEVDTSGAGVTYRAMAAIYTAYAKFYLRASHSVGRAQELAADQAAVRLAGRDATASALREIPILDVAFAHYMRQYATFGVPARLLPPEGEVYGGLRRFLGDPARREELARMRARLPREQRSPYDSHPPIAERVRLVEAAPSETPGTAPGGPDRPALELLRDREQLLIALEAATLTGEAQAFTRVEWSALADPAVRLALTENAAPLRAALSAAGTEPTVGALLDAADEGRLPAVAQGLPEGALHEGVAALAGLALAESGAGHWELTWHQGVRLVLADGTDEAEFGAAVGALADPVAGDGAAPDPAPLRKLLASA